VESGAEEAEEAEEGVAGGSEGGEAGGSEAGIRFTREITGGRAERGAEEAGATEEAEEAEEAGSEPPAFFLLRVRLSFLDSPE